MTLRAALRNVLWIVVGACCAAAGTATAARQDPVPAIAIAPLGADVLHLQQQLVDRDNEIIHQRTDLANCKATLDSVSLTNDVGDLIKRYEAVYGGTWMWDDRQRRVVRLGDSLKENK